MDHQEYAFSPHKTVTPQTVFFVVERLARKELTFSQCHHAAFCSKACFCLQLHTLSPLPVSLSPSLAAGGSSLLGCFCWQLHILSPFGNQSSGSILAAFWHHSGSILAAFWHYPGSILAAFWQHSGIILVLYSESLILNVIPKRHYIQNHWFWM